MKRLKKKNSNKIEQDKIYNLSDMNWKDDTIDTQHLWGTGIGDIDGSDPSMKGYNKGWQMDPYKQRYYAKRKEAAKEINDISFNSENLAREILELWSQADGPIQNFYEAFTMNKIPNKMKKEIAEILRQQGYDVYPVLVDERNRFANVFKKIKKIANNNINKLIECCNEVFPESNVIKLINDDIKKVGYKVTRPELNGLLDYYLLLYPDDYAAKLVNKSLTNKNTNMEHFKDIQLSNESLEALENRLNGQSDSLNNGYQNNGPGMDFGMDSTTQMNSDIGVSPNMYETRLSNKKKQ